MVYQERPISPISRVLGRPGYHICRLPESAWSKGIRYVWFIGREAKRHGIPRTPNFADFSSTGAARLPHLPASGVGLAEGNQVCVVHRPRSQETWYAKNAQFRRFLEYWGGQVTTSAGFRSWLGRRESGIEAARATARLASDGEGLDN